MKTYEGVAAHALSKAEVSRAARGSHHGEPHEFLTSYETPRVGIVPPRRTPTYSIAVSEERNRRVDARRSVFRFVAANEVVPNAVGSLGILIERCFSAIRMQFLIHPVSVAAFILFVAVIARAWRLYRS